MADGKEEEASKCKNPDLFWALRGGGAGFGILTSVAYKLHPVPASGVTGLVLTVKFQQGDASTYRFIEMLLRMLPEWLSASKYGGVWAGYFSLTNKEFNSVFVYNGTRKSAEESMADPYAFITSNSADFELVTASFFEAASLNACHDIIDKSDRTGFSSMIGSRLFPLRYCSDDKTETSSNLRTYSFSKLDQCVWSRLVRFDDCRWRCEFIDTDATSLSPAWRSGALHVVVGYGYKADGSQSDKEVAFDLVTNWTSVLRSAFPELIGMKQTIRSPNSREVSGVSLCQTAGDEEAV